MSEVQAAVVPGYSIPGWRQSAAATANFDEDGGLSCPIPGCPQVFNEKHGPRYTVEKWKAHVVNKDLHYYLWYDAAQCYQPKALANTFIRVDKNYQIAVCHYRREPVNPKKLDDHCRRCRGCLFVDQSHVHDSDMQNIGHLSEQDLQRDRKAVQGFEACEAYYCCSKLYGPSQQGIHSHLKSKRDHMPSAPVKCMRYRTSRHGYAYIPISDEEYVKLSTLASTTVVAGLPEQLREQRRMSTGSTSSSNHGDSLPTRSNSSGNSSSNKGAGTSFGSAEDVDMDDFGGNDDSSSSPGGPHSHSYASFHQAVLDQEYDLFNTYYYKLMLAVLEKLDNVTWSLHSKIASQWRYTSFKDDFQATQPGYSFITDPRNDFLVSTGQGPLWREISLNSTNTPMFIRQIVNNGHADKLDLESIKRYFDVCHELTSCIMVLLYTTMPTVQSLREFLDLRHVNDRNKLRNIFIRKNRVMIRVAQQQIVLPWILSELLIRFLTIVRPMQIQLAQRLNTNPVYVGRLQRYLFMVDYDKVTEASFGKEMESSTRYYIGKGVQVKTWRRLIDTLIQRAISSPGFDMATFTEAWFNSTGLTSLGPGTFSKLDNASILSP